MYSAGKYISRLTYFGTSARHDSYLFDELTTARNRAIDAWREAKLLPVTVLDASVVLAESPYCHSKTIKERRNRGKDSQFQKGSLTRRNYKGKN